MAKGRPTKGVGTTGPKKPTKQSNEKTVYFNNQIHTNHTIDWYVNKQ